MRWCLRPLPYRDPASLVLIDISPAAAAPVLADVGLARSRANVERLRPGSTARRAATLVASGEPEQVQSAFITWNFLSLLGVAPVAGRDFTEADASPGAPPVALLSHALWIARFGGDASIVGRTVRVSGDVRHRRGRHSGDVPISGDWRD